MKLKSTLLGAVAALALTSGAALASSVTPPGERDGIDLATPLPEGVYFVNLGSAGNWRNGAGTSTFDYEIPVIAWSTPWNILGAHVQFIVAAPMADLSAAHLGGRGGPTAVARGIYNPFVAGQLAWNFGNGFSMAFLSGSYLPVSGFGITANGVGLGIQPFDEAAPQEMLSLAYHGGGWNATANLIYTFVLKNQACNCNLGLQADSFNYDLALTKTFGKWEIGPIAYGSFDTSHMNPGSALQSQFALGGLIGYNFGPVITQFTLATDVYTQNYVAKETRFLSRVIIPLWNPEAPKVVAAKY
jgi:opacity protein-like surface antigen